jgi:hypothetical protein
MLVACSANDRAAFVGCVAFHHNGALGAWGWPMGEDQRRSDLFVLTEVKLKTENPFSTPSPRFRHCRVGANSILASVDHIVGKD